MVLFVHDCKWMDESSMNEDLDKVKESIKKDPDNSDDDRAESKLQEDLFSEKQSNQNNSHHQLNENLTLVPMAIFKNEINCPLAETEQSIRDEHLSSFHDNVVKISDSFVGSEKLTSGTIMTFRDVPRLPRIPVCAGKRKACIRKRKDSLKRQTMEKGRHAGTEILQNLKSKLSGGCDDAELSLSPTCFTGSQEETVVARCEKSPAHSKASDVLDKTPVSGDPTECSLPFNMHNPEKNITESVIPTVFLKDLSVLHKISVSGHGIDPHLPSMNNNPVGPMLFPNDKSVQSNVPVREFIPGSKLVPYYLVVPGSPPESSVPANTPTSTITSSTKSQTSRVSTKTVVECVVPTVSRSQGFSTCSETASAIEDTRVRKNSNIHTSKSPKSSLKVITICRLPASNSCEETTPGSVQESRDSTNANSSAPDLPKGEDSGTPASVKNPRLHTLPTIPVIMHGMHTVVTSAGSEQTSPQGNVLLTVASLLNSMNGATSLSKDGNTLLQNAPEAEIKDNPPLSTVTSVIKNTSMVSKMIKSGMNRPVFGSSSNVAEMNANVHDATSTPERSKNSVLICSSQTKFAGNSPENEKTITLPYSTAIKVSLPISERTKDGENKMLKGGKCSKVRQNTKEKNTKLTSKSEENCIPFAEHTQEDVKTSLTAEVDPISSYEELDPEDDNSPVQEAEESEEESESSWDSSDDEYIKRLRKKEMDSDASYDPESSEVKMRCQKRKTSQMGEVGMCKEYPVESVDKRSQDVSVQKRFLKVSVGKRPSNVSVDKTSSNISVDESCSDLFVSVGTVEFSRTQFFDFIFEKKEDETFLCKNCDESLESKEEALCHMLEHRPFKCLRCSDTFPSEKILKYHMRKHNDKLCCTHCPFSTVSQIAFAKHMKKEHQPESARMQSWMCHICGMVFTQQKAIEDHMKDAHDSKHDKREGDIECPVCKSICINVKLFRNHMLRHLGKFMYCSFEGCTYKTVSKATMSLHKKKTHGERTVSCPIEGCGFKTQRSGCSSSMDVHLNTVHYKIRKFKCTYCNKGFLAEKHLRVHLRIHLDLKPIGCNYCDYRCRQKAALNWHMKKKHVDEVIENKVNTKFKCKPGRKPRKSKKKSTQNVDEETVELDLKKRSSSRLKRKKLSNSEGETGDGSNVSKEVANAKTRTIRQNDEEEVNDHDFKSDKKTKKSSTTKEYDLQRVQTKGGKQYLTTMGKK